MERTYNPYNPTQALRELKKRVSNRKDQVAASIALLVPGLLTGCGTRDIHINPTPAPIGETATLASGFDPEDGGGPLNTETPTNTATATLAPTATATDEVPTPWAPTATPEATASCPGAPECVTPAPTDMPTATATMEQTEAPTATATQKGPDATATYRICPPTPTQTATIEAGRHCVDASDVKSILDLARANWPYDATKALDAHPAKVDHPVGNFPLEAATNETELFWTGRYNVEDVTDAGKTAIISLDGLTGLFALKQGNSINVSTPAGTLCVTGLDIAQYDWITGRTCAPSADIISAINDNKTRTDGQMYVDLDGIANAYPNARLRSDNPTDTVVSGGPLTRLLWLQIGRAHGDGIMPIDERMGMGAYLLTGPNEVTTDWPHSGLTACTAIDPAKDFPWWGR
ncbi:MAG: hypothetical protein ACMG6E_06340 [Candidatus Roizmanbacteria bacterium]